MTTTHRPPPRVETFAGLKPEQVERMLSAISRIKVGVIGDGCLDVYWHADMGASELSRETPHYPLPIVREAYSPGAAGNVAANLQALGCNEVRFLSVIGDDWRGHMLRQCFRELGIDDCHMLQENEGWVTPAYCKPIRHGHQGCWQEDPRIDFGNGKPMPAVVLAKLLTQLDEMAAKVDAITVTDQLKFGVIAPEVRDRLAYWARQGKVIVVDSRDSIGEYSGVIVKPNELEAMRTIVSGSRAVPAEQSGWDEWLEAGAALCDSTAAPCCVTLGDKGSIWFGGGDAEPVWTASYPVQPPLDIVGAGDCFTSALLCGLVVGGSGAEAMALAHLAASVVIGKIGMTGTATPQEIAARSRA